MEPFVCTLKCGGVAALSCVGVENDDGRIGVAGDDGRTGVAGGSSIEFDTALVVVAVEDEIPFTIRLGGPRPLLLTLLDGGSGGGDVTPIVVGTRNGCTPRLFPCLGAIDRWYELPLLPPYPPLRTTGALATDAPPRLILEATLMLSSPILSPS